MSACSYVPIAGHDISIDGDVWPGSAYEAHLASPEHAAEVAEEIPRARYGRQLPHDAPPCGAAHESGVTCVKPKGHDEPYYVEYDHGQWSEYSEEPHEPFDFEARHRFEWAAEVSRDS